MAKQRSEKCRHAVRMCVLVRIWNAIPFTFSVFWCVVKQLPRLPSCSPCALPAVHYAEDARTDRECMELTFY
jgi:hypothetical protein